MFVSFECLRNLLDKGYLFAYTRKLNLKVHRSWFHLNTYIFCRVVYFELVGLAFSLQHQKTLRLTGDAKSPSHDVISSVFSSALRSQPIDFIELMRAA